jgi:3-hydroxyacyl-CoA dehydrogenase/enoyl-CoA hydratase/3-hydroxybutyryl-CoA epimerase
VVERLQHYQQQCGARFAPAKSLLEMAEKNGRFYD